MIEDVVTIENRLNRLWLEAGESGLKPLYHHWLSVRRPRRDQRAFYSWEHKHETKNRRSSTFEPTTFWKIVRFFP